jgi:methanogenic corrinoid protein MtbC1
VFAASAGERHEFGAMMAAGTAGAMGWRVVYLGADLPGDSLAVAAARHQPRLVGLSVVCGQTSGLRDEIAALRGALPPDVTLVVGGQGATARAAELTDAGAVVVDSLEGFRAFLARAHPQPGRSRRHA